MWRLGKRAARARIPTLVVALCVTPHTLQAQEVCETRWILTETLRIGSVDGDVTLSPVGDLAVGPDGRIYLIQAWAHEVSVFQPDGRLGGVIGRAGGGPGEFGAWPTRLGWRGDTLWVSDRFTTHFFSADGRSIRDVSFRTPVPSEGSNLVPGTPLPDGTFLPTRLVNQHSGRFLLADRAPLRRLSAIGEVVDTVITVARPLASFTLVRETDRNGWGVMKSHPIGNWSGESWLPVTATPDGSAIVMIGEVRQDRTNASFDLLKIRFNGDTLLHQSVPYEARPITRREELLMRERFAASVAGAFRPESMSQPMSRQESERRRRIGRELITFPEYHPVVRRIVAGGDGSIWLLREAWPSPEDVWEIYGEHGKLEGLVRIEDPPHHENWNPRLRIFEASRSEVWGMTVGEFDVPYVHRYRVNRNCN